MNEILEIIYYTPVNKPGEIDRIDIHSEEEAKKIGEQIRKLTSVKKTPNLVPLNSTMIGELSILSKIKNDFPHINADDVKHLFGFLSRSMYTSSKSKEKYFGLIISSDFIFIYHFKPTISITFESSRIKEVIKYLDPSVVNWLIFLSKKNIVQEYCDISDKELESYKETEDILYSYTKHYTKGFQQLVGGEPVYKEKGDVKIRSIYDNRSDIVIETFAEHSLNLKDTIGIDWENKKIVVEAGLNLPIKEIEINNKKYDQDHLSLAKNNIYYESFEIGKIVSELKFYLKMFQDQSMTLKERRDEFILEKDNKSVKVINKPINENSDIPTIFLLGDVNKSIILNDENLIKDLSNDLRNLSKLSLIEISKFDEKYNKIVIGGISLFMKFKSSDEPIKISKCFSTLLEKIKQDSLYKKIIGLCGLILITKYFKCLKISNEIYQASKMAITELVKNEYKKPSLSLHEKSELGIELKAGIPHENSGFFDSSPQKFSEKLINDIKRKKKELIIYFIGINEDTKDFSPIPLSQMRNEFLDEVKKFVIQSGIEIYLIESFPLDEKKGILILIVG